MRRYLLATVLLYAPVCTLAEDSSVDLPQPNYTREASDAEWLAHAVHFHGHLGPWATAGLRLGAAGPRVVDAKGYFGVQVVATGPLGSGIIDSGEEHAFTRTW